MSHTLEPWRVQLEIERSFGESERHVRRIYSSNDDVAGSRAVAEVQPYATSPEADAHRIVSCVNALAGVEDPETALRLAREALGDLERFLLCQELTDRRGASTKYAALARNALNALGVSC